MARSRPRVQKNFTGKSRTKQSFRDECDINHMLATYQKGGRSPVINPYPAQYGDFSGVPDFHSALNQVNEAQAAFADLPSGVRARFQNDPGQLLEFIDNDENIPEAIELGLINDPNPGRPGQPPGPPTPDPEPEPDPSPPSPPA